MESGRKAKKGEFVEISFTGRSNGVVFDSNIKKDLETLDPKAEPKKTIVAIGKGMVIKGLDDALEGKEAGKEYSVHVPPKEGFGDRKRDLMKTIPLSVFAKQGIRPYPGGSFLMDNMLARVITISGARVITDFNNPLAGKDLEYVFKIVRFVEDLKEKAGSFLEFHMRFVPEMSVSGNTVTVKAPEQAENLILSMKDRFKDVVGGDLAFEKQALESEGKEVPQR